MSVESDKLITELIAKYSGNSDQAMNSYLETAGNVNKLAVQKAGEYGDIKDTAKAGYTGTQYYKDIMDSYNLQGGAAAKNAAASGASANSGNIDSYASANAKRQQLAFTNAGQSASLQQYNSIVNNLINGLSEAYNGMGDLTTLAGTAGNLYDSAAGNASGLAGTQNTNQTNLASAYDTNAKNLAAQQAAANATTSAAYASAAAQKYSADKEAEIAKATASNDYETIWAQMSTLVGQGENQSDVRDYLLEQYPQYEGYIPALLPAGTSTQSTSTKTTSKFPWDN